MLEELRGVDREAGEVAPRHEWLVLNLGCGTRTSARCVNLDWSPYLRLKRSRFGQFVAPAVLRGSRLERFHTLDRHVHLHNLRKGIPFADASVDAVYHSHFLEHLDRDSVPAFLNDVFRVLKPGGVQRVVVPDLERLCREYLADLDRCAGEPSPSHDQYVFRMIEQCVRREASGTMRQRPLRRAVENRLLGDARRRGETHQWMYDRVNLASALVQAGFTDVRVLDHTSSQIRGWEEIDLDRLADGSEYIAGSLYVEARRA